VWFWHPLLVSSQRRWSRPNRVRVRLQSAGDGGKTNSSPGRARNKPLKPLRRERRVISGEPVVTPCAFFLHTGHGCIGHPALPAPSDFHEGKVTSTTRANDAARTRRCVLTSVVIASVAKQSISPRKDRMDCSLTTQRKNGLLRFARNDGGAHSTQDRQIDSMPTDCASPDIAAHGTYA